MNGFAIGPKHVGNGAPCLIVAEVAQAHEGSLGMAHAYIDAVAKAGADAVKWQMHLAEEESYEDEPWRVAPMWPQDRNRYAYWLRTNFLPDEWAGLKEHAEASGLIFLCSPFSVQAVRQLDRLRIAAWKIPSGEVTNEALLSAIDETAERPVILSWGMATSAEIAQPLNRYRDVALLQCTSLYPCPPEKLGLSWLAGRYSDWPRGLSDHSGRIETGLAAVALGCDVLEVHVCFSKQQFGFDVESSITMEDLARLVDVVRFIEKAKTPVDKDAMARELEPMRELFMRKHERRAIGYSG